jgi:formylglycine-generating enzyme required for sulfatase activity
MSVEGQRLGEFEIIERLGQGGMGAVYKAWQTSLDRFVALKTLQSSLAGDAEYIARFRQEAKVDLPQSPTHPAVNVSWEDAQLFCQWLTGREQAAGRLPAGFGYRLPSDHEWSCAVEIGAGEDAAKLPNEKSQKINDAFPWGTQWLKATAVKRERQPESA